MCRIRKNLILKIHIFFIQHKMYHHKEELPENFPPRVCKIDKSCLFELQLQQRSIPLKMTSFILSVFYYV
jgi:hypothetical protein